LLASKLNTRTSLVFGLGVAFLVFVLLFGGGSRADVLSNMVMRPLAVLVCAVAIVKLPRERIRSSREMLAFAAVVLGYVLIQLIPVPPSIWSALPGRELAVEVERVAGIAPQWRPATLSPSGGWNAFYSLFVPLAVLLLGIQLQREERFALLYVVLGFGALTALVGMLQVLAPSNGLLYPYRITNYGLEVGLFANRNHQAVFLSCLFPMIAVAASQPGADAARSRLRLLLAGIAGVVLVPLILATASRAGLVTAAIGLVSVPFLFSPPGNLQQGKRKKDAARFGLTGKRLAYGGGAALVALVALIGYLMASSPTLQRLFETNQDEARGMMWSTTASIIGDYLPWGSGIGSFVEAFKVAEPTELLGPAYVNHAHNDYLELLLTGGVPAAVLLLVAALWCAAGAFRGWLRVKGARREAAFTRMASVVILILAVASAVDYPLRTPSLMAVFVIAAIWLKGDRVGGIGQKGFA